jgi:hypothetical protein
MENSNKEKKSWEEIDNQIGKYRASIEESFFRFLENERSIYNQSLDLLLHFYFFNSYLADEVFKSVKSNEDVLLTLLSKTSLNVFGIYNCLRNGLIIESSMILRSIFETCVNIELIVRGNQEERIKLFSDFHFIEVYNHIKQNEKLLQNGIIKKLPVNNEFKLKIEEKYNQVKINYNLKRPYHWAWKIFKDEIGENNNPSLRLICKKLGKDYEYDYVKLYSTVSKSVHTSPTTQNILKSKNIVSNAPNFSKLINGDVYLTIEYASKIVKNVLEYYKQENHEMIILFLEHFLQLTTGVTDNNYY